jgi:hypothetical protein
MEVEDLVGAELTSVEFVQDYLQLKFDGPTLTFYEWPDVFREEGSYAYGEPEFRNVLCDLISSGVTAASLVEGEAIEVQFENGVSIRTSLRLEDISSPEAGSLASGEPGDELLTF